MKKLGLILMSLILCIIYTNAQEKDANPVFKTTTHNFGKIAEEVGSAVCEFPFVNKGDAPLIIQRVATSCGCTTPEYTKEPVLPGRSGEIKVSYSTSGRVGNFTKRITVFTNVKDSVYTLIIKGEVLPRK